MNTVIKIKAKNVTELLKLLEKSNEIVTINLDLEISKSVIKVLDNYSEDWNFLNEEVTTKELKEIKNENFLEIESKDGELNPLDYYISKLGINNYNTIATLVESIFKICKISPNITFESELFFNVLEKEYNKIANSSITIEHSLLSMIIESYYRDSKIEDAIKDTTEKLKSMWISKKLSEHPNTTSLTKVLYGLN